MAPKSCNLDNDEAEILKASSPPSSPSMPLKSCEKSRPFGELKGCGEELKVVELKSCEESAVEEPKMKFGLINRCCVCQKRVGLLGFRCRCGDLFCSRHRYSDMHECSFDYKKVGREEIERANPVVRAAKIIKI